MKNQAIFNIYTTFATTLANMMYPFIECHILDYENPEAPTCHSYFKNKKTTVTGHEAIPDMLHKNKIQEKLTSNLVNFAYVNKKGKSTKASALGIYNGEKLIGCLAIQLDTTYFKGFMSILSHFIKTNDENFIFDNQRFDSSKIKNDIESVVSNYLLENKLGNEKLKKAHKKEIIKLLVEKDYLAKKGAITKIAHVLSLSRPTIYRYVKALLKANRNNTTNTYTIPKRLEATLTF